MTQIHLCRAVALAALILSPVPTLAQQTHVIEDGMGRSVTLPVDIARIVAGFFPFPSAYFVATGSLERLVAVSSDSRHAAERSVFGKIAPGVLDLPTNHIEGGVLNAEELLKLDPEVYVTHEGNASLEIAERAGVPVLALDVLSKGQGNTIQTFENWMTLIGTVTGETVRTDELIAYANQTLADTRATMAALSEDDKPRALFFLRACMRANSRSTVRGISATSGCGKPAASIWRPKAFHPSPKSAWSRSTRLTPK